MLTHPAVLPEPVDPAVDGHVNVPVDAGRPASSCRTSSQRAAASADSPDTEGAGVAPSLVVEERFAIVPEWLLDADVSDAAVRLYVVLLRYGQSSGRRMPSRRVLAQRLRKKSVDSVDRAMTELVAVGAVVVQHRREGGVNLTNRYVVRSTSPGTGAAGSAARTARGGGRTDAATTPGCRAPEWGSARTPALVGGRNGAAGGGRTAAAGVATPVRPNPEQLTQSNTRPPQPSTRTTRPRTTRREAPEAAVLRSATAVRPGASGPERPSATNDATADEPADEVARLLGPVDLGAVAERCRRLRQDLGLPARLWTAGHLGQVLVSAVRDHDRPAEAAVPALLAIAADPATRSPARLSCPGPWWDTPAHLRERCGTSTSSAVADTRANELASLEQRLAETDGARVALQRQARDLLLREGRPVTRLTQTVVVAIRGTAGFTLPAHSGRPALDRRRPSPRPWSRCSTRRVVIVMTPPRPHGVRRHPPARTYPAGYSVSSAASSGRRHHQDVLPARRRVEVLRREPGRRWLGTSVGFHRAAALLPHRGGAIRPRTSSGRRTTSTGESSRPSTGRMRDAR